MKSIKFILICLVPLLFHSFVAQSQVIISYAAKFESVKPDKKGPDPEIFKEYGLQLIVPEGWQKIHPDESPFYYSGNYFKLNLSSEAGDVAWIWRDKVHVDPYATDVLEDVVFDYAPNQVPLRTYEIKNSGGTNTRLYVWEATHIKNGNKERFKLFAALNEAPVFKPRLQDAYLLGRSMDMDVDGSTEADFLIMAEKLQTYNESKKGDDFETSDQIIDKAISSAFENREFEINIAIADSLEKPADYNGKSMDWNFQTYPGWARDIKIEKEDDVVWAAPSIVKSELYGDTEFIQLSKDHIFAACSGGIFLVNAQTGTLQWYKKIGYGGYNFAIGNDDQLIIAKEAYGITQVKSLDSESGNVDWSVELSGDYPVDFHVDDSSESLILVQNVRKQSRITSLDLNTGHQRWLTSRDHTNALQSPPLPYFHGQSMLAYYDGIEGISIKDGQSLWKIDNIKLDDSSPEPRVHNDTLVVIARDNSVNMVDAPSGELLSSIQGRKDSEYTNIYLLNSRLYLRGKTVNDQKEDLYYLDTYSGNTYDLLWSFTDSLPTVSGLIDDGSTLYTSFWDGPIALDKNSGEVRFRSIASETGRTFPVSLREFGDTIVYVGELVIAGFNKSSGGEIFKLGFNPVSQSENLDAIDPQVIKHYEHLKFYGKPGLKEVTLDMGNFNLLFNLSNASQERASQLASLSRQNASMYRSTGYESYYYKSKLQANQYKIESAFSRAYANSALLLGSVNTAASAVSKMTAQERKRLAELNNRRTKLMKLYDSQDGIDYLVRKMEVFDGSKRSSKQVVVHLPSGKVVWSLQNERVLDDLLLDQENNRIYYHSKRMVPELYEQSFNKEEGTAAHGFYLVAQPLNK